MKAHSLKLHSRITSGHLLSLLFFLLLACGPAFAGEAMPWDSGLKKLGDALTGTTAMYVSILAFAATMLTLIWGGEMSDMLKKLVQIVCAGSGLVGCASLAKNLLGVQVTGAVVDSFHALQAVHAAGAGALIGVA